MIWRVLLLLLGLALAGQARAHEVRPAYLELVEQPGGEFRATWKQPALQAGVLELEPVLPEGCAGTGQRTREVAPAALISRWTVRCAGGLDGEIRIAGLERTLTSAFIRVSWRDGRVAQGAINANDPAFQTSGPRAPGVAAYFGLGVEHILLGFDHLCFVAGLVLLISRIWPLTKALTAFTLAHSLTLGAAAFGLAGLPQKPVEVLIAVSIVVVGYEALRATRGQGGLTARAPWLVAFGFGLLHGFGFASALSEIGLPADARLAALLLFNLGVEAGQLLVVALLLAAIALATHVARLPRARIQLAASYLLGGLGVFWFLDRLTS